MTSAQDKFRKKLSLAYNKVAKKLGKKYGVYRPVSMTNMLDTSNFVYDVDCSFTIDESYANVKNEGFTQFKAHCDWRKIQQGDILHDGQETFVILWSQGIDMAIAVKADYLVEIWRPDWTTTDGLEPNPVRWARNVPASFQSIASQGGLNIPRAGTSQVPSWEVRIWSMSEDIQFSDTIVRADSLSLTPTSIKNNKLCQILNCHSS